MKNDLTFGVSDGYGHMFSTAHHHPFDDSLAPIIEWFAHGILRYRFPQRQMILLGIGSVVNTNQKTGVFSG